LETLRIMISFARVAVVAANHAKHVNARLIRHIRVGPSCKPADRAPFRPQPHRNEVFPGYS
jgi:hypothetical protein